MTRDQWKKAQAVMAALRHEKIPRPDSVRITTDYALVIGWYAGGDNSVLTELRAVPGTASSTATIYVNEEHVFSMGFPDIDMDTMVEDVLSRAQKIAQALEVQA